jgi:hypothetical protein
MKHLKILGPAAVAAMALTALIGVSSSSAAELCSTNTSPCTGTIYGSSTSISANLKAGTTSRLTSNFGAITCKKSTMAGKTTNGEGHGEITTVSFTGCTDPFGGSCTFNSVNPPFTVSTAATGGGNGTITTTATEAHETEGKNPGMTVTCTGIGLNCTYSRAEMTLNVTGGNPATILAENESLEFTAGGFCPSETSWDYEYEITAPKPLFLE